MIKKILFILIAIFITQPIFANPEAVVPIQSPYSGNEAILNEIPQEVIPEASAPQTVQTTPSNGDIEKNSIQEPYDKSDLKREVVPETRGELFMVALMFLKVMFAVVICSIILYFLLLLVKKGYSEPVVHKTKEENLPEDLRSPQNENDALRTFFNQTKNH